MLVSNTSTIYRSFDALSFLDVSGSLLSFQTLQIETYSYFSEIGIELYY